MFCRPLRFHSRSSREAKNSDYASPQRHAKRGWAGTATFPGIEHGLTSNPRYQRQKDERRADLLSTKHHSPSTGNWGPLQFGIRRCMATPRNRVMFFLSEHRNQTKSKMKTMDRSHGYCAHDLRFCRVGGLSSIAAGPSPQCTVLKRPSCSSI